ncbi:hypothetical protein J6590_020091 [Homalodisca vitripennis]|nr:hypothetical protein J6590_020091 [Homalodisca vitripennis]
MNGRAAETGSDEDLVRTSTLYSSTSSLSSASPLHSDSVTHLTQQVVNSPGPPSLLMSPIPQLLPSTTIRMLPADTHFVHSHIPTTGIAIQNGVLNHSTVTLATKHPVSTESSTLMASGLLSHSLVVPQPSSFLLAAPSHISDKNDALHNLQDHVNKENASWRVLTMHDDVVSQS